MGGGARCGHGGLMGVLHLVESVPAFGNCRVRAGEGDAILLIGDGVYAAAQMPEMETLSRHPVFVLEEDLALRGMAPMSIKSHAAVTDYRGFVALTLQHHPVVTWR